MNRIHPTAIKLAHSVLHLSDSGELGSGRLAQLQELAHEVIRAENQEHEEATVLRLEGSTARAFWDKLADEAPDGFKRDLDKP